MFPEGPKPHFPSSHHHFGNKITTRVKTISVRKTLKITDLDRYDNSLIQACYLTLFNHFMQSYNRRHLQMQGQTPLNV